MKDRGDFLKESFHPLVIDTAVPISKYPDMVEWSQKIVEKKGLKGYASGRAGSGNLHMEILRGS